jgi:hypothetical protein
VLSGFGLLKKGEMVVVQEFLDQGGVNVALSDASLSEPQNVIFNVDA